MLHGLHGSVWGYTGLLLYAIIIGWLAVSTGGLEAGIALHIALNGLSGVLTVFVVIVTGVTVDSGNASTAGWQQPAVQIPVVAVYAAVAWWVSRRMNRTAPARTPASAVPAAMPVPAGQPCEMEPTEVERS